MAKDFPVPKNCPAISWCNKSIPCYCQDSPAQVEPSPTSPAQPVIPDRGP